MTCEECGNYLCSGCGQCASCNSEDCDCLEDYWGDDGWPGYWGDDG